MGDYATEQPTDASYVTGGARRKAAEVRDTDVWVKPLPQFSSVPPLPYSDTVDPVDYLGPTEESNWVLPGRVLVGAYPSSLDDDLNAQILTSILRLGITTFVCLQHEYEHHGVTEYMWRNGYKLRPYIYEAVQLLDELKDWPCGDKPEGLEFVHFPIVDCATVSDARVLRLCKDLVKRLTNGENLYIHCWGGHGRTGTVIGVMLGLMYNLSPADAMSFTQFTHDMRACPMGVPSPQTDEQRAQVTRIVTSVLARRKRHADMMSRGASVTRRTPRTPASGSRTARSTRHSPGRGAATKRTSTPRVTYGQNGRRISTPRTPSTAVTAPRKGPQSAPRASTATAGTGAAATTSSLADVGGSSFDVATTAASGAPAARGGSTSLTSRGGGGGGGAAAGRRRGPSTAASSGGRGGGSGAAAGAGAGVNAGGAPRPAPPSRGGPGRRPASTRRGHSLHAASGGSKATGAAPLGSYGFSRHARVASSSPSPSPSTTPTPPLVGPALAAAGGGAPAGSSHAGAGNGGGSGSGSAGVALPPARTSSALSAVSGDQGAGRWAGRRRRKSSASSSGRRSPSPADLSGRGSHRGGGRARGRSPHHPRPGSSGGASRAGPPTGAGRLVVTPSRPGGGVATGTSASAPRPSKPPSADGGAGGAGGSAARRVGGRGVLVGSSGGVARPIRPPVGPSKNVAGTVDAKPPASGPHRDPLLQGSGQVSRHQPATVSMLLADRKSGRAGASGAAGGGQHAERSTSPVRGWQTPKHVEPPSTTPALVSKDAYVTHSPASSTDASVVSSAAGPPKVSGEVRGAAPVVTSAAQARDLAAGVRNLNAYAPVPVASAAGVATTGGSGVSASAATAGAATAVPHRPKSRGAAGHPASRHLRRLQKPAGR